MGNVYSYATLVEDLEAKVAQTDIEVAQREIKQLEAEIVKRTAEASAIKTELEKWKSCAYKRSFPALEGVPEDDEEQPGPELKWQGGRAWKVDDTC